MKNVISRGAVWVSIVLLGSACDRQISRSTKFLLLPSSRTGMDFNNSLKETHQMNIISYPDFYSGGGVSIGDVDNDGLSDVFFTGNQVPARLYKNIGGLRFKDVTKPAKLDKMGRGWFTGTCMVDINSDGYLDIYISKSGMEAPDDRANLLFVNNRDGTFTEKAPAYGLDNRGFGVNAAFFDYDNDGDLDAYIANQVSSRLNSSHAQKLRHVIDPYAGDKLYENKNGRYVDVTKAAGLYSSKAGFAHGAAVGDVNNDGWEDIFVSNDFFEYDYLYLNNGDKTFREVIREATRHISLFSMGNDMADFDNDGLLDLMVLDMVAEDNRRMYENTGGNNEERFQRMLQHGLHHQYMFNMLHLNNGNETFSEIGMLAGISRTDWSWAPLLADFDNDGLKDIYVSNGLRKDIRNIDWGNTYRNMTRLVKDFSEFESSQWDLLLNSLPSEKISNYMFRNNGDLTFSKVSDDWGLSHKSWSNGVAFGDLDNDGDLDLVVNNVDQEAFVFENRQHDSNYIRFNFKGSENNPMGLGTKVKIYHGDKFQYQQHYISRGYRSSMEPVMHFGLGRDSIITKIEVKWPDGRSMTFRDQRSNKVVRLNYEDAGSRTISGPGVPTPLFSDVTEELGVRIRHRENEMNDFMRAPLLPYKLSAQGPAFDAVDVNGDGLDDLFLGGSFRYPGRLLIQDKAGRFVSVQEALWKEDRHYEDVDALFFDADNDGDQDLYVVSGGTENTLENKGFMDRLYLNDGKGSFFKPADALPDFCNSGSVVKGGDIDGDGDLDLFVGGRVIPGRYPLPADSYLLVNTRGRFSNETDHRAAGFNNLGMVTDAAWSDYDLDGDVDLIVVGEWMEITLFNNDSGKLEKVDNLANGLEKSSGWWWSIEAMDLDRDGDDDFVVGNMGLNYKFKPADEHPLELFAADFDNNGKTDFAFGHYQDGKLFPFFDRGKAVRQTAGLADRIPTNDMYASLNLYEIYGKEMLENAYRKSIYQLKSGYVENLGDHKFEFRPFDNYAQISNINAILLHDVNRDGNTDLILAGNLYAMEAETIRNDAGVGVWMKGEGNGTFIPVRPRQSGLFVDGDVKEIREIKTISGSILVFARNNDFLRAYKVIDDSILR